MPTRFPNQAKVTLRTSASRILIADDAPSGRELLRTILERSGYEVVEACDGAEVIEKVSHFRPHLLILDLQMPKVDGYATVIALRKMPTFHEVPVMALAAALPEVSPEQMTQAGFTRCIVKPINPAKLRESVAQLLQGVGAASKTALDTQGAPYEARSNRFIL